MIEKITPFPLYIYKIKATHHKEIKDYLMKHVYPKFAQDGPNGGLQKIFTDYLPGTGAMIHWPYIYDRYKEDLDNVLSEIGFDMTKPWDVRMKGWYNFTTHNDEEWPHDHMGGASNINYSFVHYVTVEDENDGTIFLNPNYKLTRAIMPTKNVNYLPESIFNDRYQIKVEEGDIVLFPSWMDHTAPKHTTDNLRITNAVNVMMKLKNQDEDGF
jgi:hypothetical protein|tara:strand:+ start:10732 stop:11370 length:639 start_codon:yes stop_codon:yes gene_type:complete